MNALASAGSPPHSPPSPSAAARSWSESTSLLPIAAVRAMSARSFPFNTNGAAAFTASTSNSSGVSTSPSFIVHECFIRRSTCCPLTSNAPAGKCFAAVLASSASPGSTESCDAAADGAIHPAPRMTSASPSRQPPTSRGKTETASSPSPFPSPSATRASNPYAAPPPRSFPRNRVVRLRVVPYE
eukprot:31267-Pelagococcus_subviridis.AAC.5